jgi:cytochrome P450
MTAASTNEAPHFVLRGGEAWRDPWDAYRRLREVDPVHRVTDTHHPPFWVLSRFADVFAAARDHETFSSAQGLTPDVDSMAMFDESAVPIVMMDPPDHTTMRRMVSRQMTPRRVAGIEEQVTRFVDERLDAIDSADEIDIVSALLKPLPSFVVAHYLGVPTEDRARFDGWTEAIVAANASGEVAGAAAALDLFAYADELIRRRTSEPGEDLVTDLVELGDEAVSAMWIVGFIFTMVTGGNDTTTGLLSGACELLTSHRDQRQLLLDDPALIGPAVEEFLRLTTPVQNLARTTTRPVTIEGVEIPAGDKVLLLYGSANRDEHEFGPTANVLDVRRPVARTLAFGSGAHHCLGAAAARLQARVALTRLLDRFGDFSVDAERGMFASGAFVRRYESLPFRPTG